MKQVLDTILLLLLLVTTSCGKNNEPEATAPIHFDQNDYTVKLGVGAVIPFTGGGGVYELSAGNPGVLGKFAIDMERPGRLYIQPAAAGESTLTIVDVNTHSSVTLNITVVDFYLTFKVEEITGKNTNLHIQRGDEIRFIRDAANSKTVNIMREDHLAHTPYIAASGRFDIQHTDTYVYTMLMDLHSGENQELEVFEYILGGDGTYLSIFEHFFGFDFKPSPRSQPVQRIEMTLTDNTTDCTITCTLQQFN